MHDALTNREGHEGRGATPFDATRLREQRGHQVSIGDVVGQHAEREAWCVDVDPTARAQPLPALGAKQF